VASQGQVRNQIHAKHQIENISIKISTSFKELHLKLHNNRTSSYRTSAISGARLWNSLPPDLVACVTHCHGSIDNLKHFYSDSLTTYHFVLVFSHRGPCTFYTGQVVA